MRNEIKQFIKKLKTWKTYQEVINLKTKEVELVPFVNIPFSVINRIGREQSNG